MEGSGWQTAHVPGGPGGGPQCRHAKVKQTSARMRAKQPPGKTGGIFKRVCSTSSGSSVHELDQGTFAINSDSSSSGVTTPTDSSIGQSDGRIAWTDGSKQLRYKASARQQQTLLFPHEAKVRKCVNEDEEELDFLSTVPDQPGHGNSFNQNLQPVSSGYDSPGIPRLSRGKARCEKVIVIESSDDDRAPDAINGVRVHSSTKSYAKHPRKVRRKRLRKGAGDDTSSDENLPTIENLEHMLERETETPQKAVRHHRLRVQLPEEEADAAAVDPSTIKFVSSRVGPVKRKCAAAKLRKLTSEERADRMQALLAQTERIEGELQSLLSHQLVARASLSPSAAESSDLFTNAFAPAPNSPNGSACSVQLKFHQMVGVKWLLALHRDGRNAILADDMGLGKTIQTLALVHALKHSGKHGCTLIVAPVSVCDHWLSDAEKFFPGLRVHAHVGSVDHRMGVWEEVLLSRNDDVGKMPYDVIVTSFELVSRDFCRSAELSVGQMQFSAVLQFLRGCRFSYLVVDEAHRLKNKDSMMFAKLSRDIASEHRLLLTGTPLQNNLQELWALLNFCVPSIFASLDSFEAWFVQPFNEAVNTSDFECSVSETERLVIIERLHRVLRPFILRRTKSEVFGNDKALAPLIERDVYCPQSNMQVALAHIFSLQKAKKVRSASQVMRFRQAAIHPFMLSTSLYDDSELESLDKGLVCASGKFTFLCKALPELLCHGHKMLIFSQFKGSLDLVESLLMLLGERWARIDGEFSLEDRQTLMADFCSAESGVNVFLLSTRAGGVGLNLQSADTVILLDQDLNPLMDKQAISRCHRMGQMKPVLVLRLITADSVDELILSRCRSKIEMEEQIIEAGRYDALSSTDERKQVLLSILENRQQQTVSIRRPDLRFEWMHQSSELLHILNRCTAGAPHRAGSLESHSHESSAVDASAAVAEARLKCRLPAWLSLTDAMLRDLTVQAETQAKALDQVSRALKESDPRAAFLRIEGVLSKKERVKFKNYESHIRRSPRRLEDRFSLSDVENAELVDAKKNARS
ncbi:SWI/SNF chromatin-remodeling complex subunit snf22 [Porphyridium purpureum]|uniref:SWI/SNF chromatin-remodeling complex subunit snf22 n=1 Tax=Porphyridium purpureum TaxID=35688 RepID=A0A5J4Z786_PORPP|nr:SWI/SNF chromatin-remodeling complex subunit snf22 [Porphyridium purpureum]|eukprot:POR4893..scf295_1